LSAVEILRQIWIQHDYRGTEPGMKKAAGAKRLGSVLDLDVMI